MEHIIVTPVEGGYTRLVAEPNYELYAVTIGRVVSEAVVREVRPGEFVARPVETPVVESSKKTTRKKKS